MNCEIERVCARKHQKGPRFMNAGIIQVQPCPRCAIRRTVRLAGSSFCHNCHLQWCGALGAAFLPRMKPAYSFAAQETVRLTIYRAAVRAGFYNDR
jgi:hypothetical protein